MTPISAGAVLRRSIAIWGKNLAPFLVLTLLVTLPAHIVEYLFESKQITTGDPMLDATLPGILDTVLIFIASGAICWTVDAHLRGQPIRFAHSVLVGLRKLPRVMLVGFVSGIILAIGLMAYILPGLFLATVLFVVVPSAVIEGGGGLSPIVRSASLTAGHRLQLFVIVLVNFALNLGAAELAVDAFEDNIQALWTARISLFVVVASLNAVTATVAYHDLVAARGGAKPDDVARTFE